MKEFANSTQTNTAKSTTDGMEKREKELTNSNKQNIKNKLISFTVIFHHLYLYFFYYFYNSNFTNFIFYFF